MNEKWKETILEVMDNLTNIKHIECPRCGECTVDYLYVINEETRVGYLTVWCDSCKKGTHISRVELPEGAKYITFEDAEKVELPTFELE